MRNNYNISSLAVAPMDYGAVDTLLSFAACQIRSCVNVSIINDVVLENVESFDVILDRAPELDSRITLEPVNGVIELTDNDGISSLLYRIIYIYLTLFMNCNSSYSFYIPSRCCGGSGEDLLPGLRGCGCGRGVCYCVQSK